MTDYQMPVLTEQQKEAITSWLKSGVDRLNRIGEDHELTTGQFFRRITNQIALAALTAEPVAYYGDDAYYNTHKAAMKDGVESITALYESPFMPVIKQEGEQ